MISLADLRPATLAVGLALLSIAASPQADAGATAPASVASDNVPCTIAELGNAATVGIYCEVDPHEKYYGTGAIVTSDGHILTSTTVVPAGSKKIQVYFATDHSRRTAEIVEIKDAIESTLLKVNARGLPFLHVSDDPPRVGERAYTFGNAHSMIRLGDKASFSTGLVSGYYHVKSDDNQSSYVGLALESDAAINPGQDGGPLLDSRGRLAGIISLSCADARWQGMAVPIGLIRKGLDAIRDGRVKLGTASPVKPPPEDTADGNPFAARARAFAASLVAIRVERKYPPERMPQLHWAAYKRTLAGWTARKSAAWPIFSPPKRSSAPTGRCGGPTIPSPAC
jgi:S1-C subfamily serine protease